MADYKFIEWVKTFSALCAERQEQWGLPAQETADVCTAVTEYTALYETSADRTRKTALTGLIRDFSRRHIDRNGNIPEAERERLRMPKPPLSAPPEFGFTFPGAGRLEVHYGGSQGKPKGAAGAMLSYAIRDVPPKSQELLLHSVFTIQTPYHFAFAEEERGRILYVALRWLNHEGEAGPWSEIRRAVIP